MQFQPVTIGGQRFNLVQSPDVVIHSAQNVLDLLYDTDTLAFVLFEHQINPDFFELRSGLAGDVMQKFYNYSMKIVIIGDFARYESRALRDFIVEANRTKHVIFVDSLETAQQILG